MQQYTLSQFQRDYPDNDTCLERIFQPEPCVCGRNKWYRVKSRPIYSCACGKQISPLAGTIFEKSTTPLTTWFYVMYLMSQTKSGVSAAFIQRMTGLNYDTAWRMMHKIRELMADDSPRFSEAVEVDETFMKAKPWRNSRVSRGSRAFFASPKILGIVGRESGRAKVRVLRDMKRETIHGIFANTVEEGSLVATDGSHLYSKLHCHYHHDRSIHYGPKPGAEGLVFAFKPIKGDSTQRVENLWSVLKRGIRGTYIQVSPRYLQAYADEYAWRYSNRRSGAPLFELLLKQITRAN